jgi:AraC-like DNA-binding protein
LYGPIFYIYIKSLVLKYKFGVKDLLHLIPLLFYVVNFWNYNTSSYQIKLQLWDTNSEGFISFPYLDWVLNIIIISYLMYSYNIFNKYYKRDREMFIWLRAIHLVFTGFVLSLASYYIFNIFNVLTVELDYVITFFMLITLSLTAYFGINHSSVFNGKNVRDIVPFVKYKRTGLSKSISKEFKEKLLNYMEEGKPYLNYELRLDDLSDSLNISRHHVSQVINEQFKMNFFEFINQYRVEEAERILCSKKYNYTMSEIAYEVGFNNRISFYNAFKKAYGLPPKKFLEYINEKVS